MSDNYLLVPMHLDAMVLNQEASLATPFLRFQMEYNKLQSFNNPQPPPFAGASPQPPSAGIYLHWTLPKAHRHGTHQDDGSTDFPLAPNRHLIVRMQAGVSPDQAIKAWIVQSDYLGDDGTSPYVDPGGTNSTPQATKIGKALRFTPALTSLPAQTSSFLKALGPGSVIFSVFEPGAQNVFSFYDDVTANDDQTQLSTGTFSYYVVGWYADPTSDPLNCTQWQVNTDASLSGTYINDTFDWFVYADSASLPKQMLIHALVDGVAWDRDADNPPAANYPTNLQNTVKVAVGNTAIDALAAIVRLDKNNQTEADLLEAFQYGLLEQFDQPGSSEALNMAIRQHWFGAMPGGTLWTITAKERTGNTALPAPPAPVITAAQQAALAALNVSQVEGDRQQRILESMQWNLFGLWWKTKWQQNVFNRIALPLDTPMKNWLAKQLPLQIGEGSTCNHPCGSDPSQESWTICKVKAQQNLVAQLTQQVQAASTQLQSLLDPKQQLKALNQPQYYSPNDPVVLVTGLGRSTNLDPEDGVMCRLPSQTVAALTISGASYCAAAACGNDIQNQIPVLSDPNHLLPDAIEQLNTESFFLSPALFAQNILGSTSRTGDVQQAIKSLPQPAAGGHFAPLAYAMPEWAQPWVPLLLDWQVTVLQGPAYTSEAGQPTCTFAQSNWQFNGTDYVWSGPTSAGGGNFDETNMQMQLTGRTFITPFLSFTLADQLEQYVQKHKLRDPNLEALLEDLEHYLEGIKNQDILSQRLSGMMNMMIERNNTQNVAPFGDIANALGDAHHGYPMPYPDRTTLPVWNFAPLRGTFFVINKLTVIDAFGRSIDLTLANYSADPQTASSVAEYYFYPITGRNLKAPTAIDPSPGQGESTDPTQRMMQLTPRLIQDSQLSFRLLSNDGQNHEIDQMVGANPVCGWMVPNHLDRSLALYAADGTAWGELYLSLQAENHYVPTWQPDPTNPQAPQSVAAIPNDYVQAMLQALCNRTDEGTGFYDFMQTIDETLWTINPRGRRQDQNLSVLIGRPLAIVRAKLSLRLRGLPVTNQDWWNSFNVDRTSPGDPSQPAPIGTVDGGVFNDLWPVRLGSQALRNDGVIGYYLDDPNTPADSFQTFNAVVVPADAQTDYLSQIGQNNYLQLRLIDDTVASPAAAENQVGYLTMLVDPRGSLHAFTGLLPVVSLDIPSQFITPALQKMAYLFRAGPFLTPPDVIRIPRPAERKGTWSWFDHVLDTSAAISAADGNVSFPTTPPLVKEGWLKFTPNPPQDDDQLVRAKLNQQTKKEGEKIMSSGGGSLQLSYAFVPDPNPIRASLDGQNPNTINLQVIISNPNAPDVVTLQGIVIQIPVGAELGGDLSAATNLPSPVPATSAQWNINSSGSTITIQPQSGTTAQIADTLIFTLSGIVVNKEVGTVQLTITEVDQNGNPTADTSHQLVKLAPDFPITSFKATPDILNNLEESVTLNWTCSSQGQQYTYRVYSVDPESQQQPGPNSWEPKECLKNGDCYTCAAGQTGVTTPLLVPQDTTMTITFCLDVIKTDSSGSRSVYKTLSTTVRVEVPTIFGNSTQSVYLSGQVVMLRWLAFNASRCAVALDSNIIDNNAPTDTYLQGYPVVLPNQQGQHQLTVTAYAKTGSAQYTFNFPEFTIAQYPPIPIDESPLAIAATPDSQLVLVVNSYSQDVQFIDTHSCKVISTIPVGAIPSGIAITPDGTLALVVNTNGNNVSVIDIASRRTEPTAIPVGNVATPIAITLDKTNPLALVGNRADGTITVIDIASRTVKPPLIPTGQNPSGITITPDGKYAFVANLSSNTVMVIDIATLTVESQIIPVANGPISIAITPDGVLALVANFNSNDVAVIDIATRTVEPARIPVGQVPWGIAITPDGVFALVVNSSSSSVTVIDIANRRAVPTSIPTGYNPNGIAITPDGRLAFVPNYNSGTVTVI
jgi:YVTN family beta-propeller protein